MNKAKEAVALFDAIHSVDRSSLCERSRRKLTTATSAALFVEVNTGSEAKKPYYRKEADAFLAACSGKYGLKISGLMCIPP